MTTEKCVVLGRLAVGEVEAAGYHHELIRSNFASPVPLLHGNTTSEGEHAEECDVNSGHGDFGELLPRSIGFRAACLTFEAERTSGEPIVGAVRYCLSCCFEAFLKLSGWKLARCAYRAASGLNNCCWLSPSTPPYKRLQGAKAHSPLCTWC